MSRKLPKSHFFNRKRYKILWNKPRGAEGLCDDPAKPAKNRRILVNRNAPEHEVSDTLIHEVLHAELWMLDEETISRVATNLNALLIKCGMDLKLSKLPEGKLNGRKPCKKRQ